MMFKIFAALVSIVTAVHCSHVTALGPDVLPVTYDADKTKSLGGTTCLSKIDDCTTSWSPYTYASTATIVDPNLQNHTVTRVWTTSTPVIIPASDATTSAPSSTATGSSCTTNTPSASTETQTLSDSCSSHPGVTSLPEPQSSTSATEVTMTTLEVTISSAPPAESHISLRTTADVRTRPTEPPATTMRKVWKIYTPGRVA
ncbi:hypothetical protein F4809DRAFT_609788 [Biscogniauxia mediterranea]|nr:hypothetical protein F4809DRAFT_609788 [Biscogniauxia mediterranea]